VHFFHTLSNTVINKLQHVTSHARLQTANDNKTRNKKLIQIATAYFRLYTHWSQTRSQTCDTASQC